MKRNALLVLSFALLGSVLVGCAPDIVTSTSDSQTTTTTTTSEAPKEISNYVQVYETSGNKSSTIERKSDLIFKDYEYDGNIEVTLDLEKEYNELTGYGSALTHSAAMLLNNKPAIAKDILNQMYGEDGAGFTSVRIPLGTSDYTPTAMDYYTFDDVPKGETDFEFNSFSIEKDKQALIPVLKTILEINPDIQIFAAPWSAPAWMKTNKSLIGGSLEGVENDTYENPSKEEKAYAMYLFKTVETYAKEGIYIDYLSILNEPFIMNVKYPSMHMEGKQYYRVAKEFVKLAKDSDIDFVRLSLFDHNPVAEYDVAFETFVQPLIDDPQINEFVAGFALHCYDGNWPNIYSGFMATYTQLYPDKQFWITEITESQGGDYAQNLAWAANNVTVGPEGYGVNGAMYWNMALRSDGSPAKGNNAKLRGVVTLDDDGEWYFNTSYFAMSHVSRFAHKIDGVLPRRIDAYSSNEFLIKSAAFKNADDTYAVVLTNVYDRTLETVNVVLGDKMVALQIGPQSITTLVLTRGDVEQLKRVEYEHIDIYQNGYYDYSLHVELAEKYDGVEFYLESQPETYKNKVEYTQDGDIYMMDVQTGPGDVYLNVLTSNDKVNGNLCITIPRMTPFIKVMEDAETGNEVLQFNFQFNIGMSWSSFCDPNGKNVYKSSQDTFDSTAVKVNVKENGEDDDIYIITNEYVDKNLSSEQPYYYAVLEGKNGLTTFYSCSVTYRDDIIDQSSEMVDLVLIDGKVHVVYMAAYLQDDYQNTRLVVKDNTLERYDGLNQGGRIVSMEVCVENISRKYTWFDILIERSNGNCFDIYKTSAINPNKSLKGSDGRTYVFKEWSGLLKVNVM